jgi:hypothetical protein
VLCLIASLSSTSTVQNTVRLTVYVSIDFGSFGTTRMRSTEPQQEREREREPQDEDDLQERLQSIRIA